MQHSYHSCIIWFGCLFAENVFLLISRDYEVNCPSAPEVREIVNKHLAEKELLDNSLPSVMVIGPFHVSVEGVRQSLSKKCKALATSMLDILAKNLHRQVEDVSFIVGTLHQEE